MTAAPAWTHAKYPPLPATVVGAHIGIYPYCLSCAVHLHGMEVLQRAAVTDGDVRTANHALLVELHHHRPSQDSGLPACHVCRRDLTGPPAR